MLQVQEEVARMRHLEATREEADRELAQAKTRIIEAANAAIDEIIRASGLTYGEILGQPLPQLEAKPARKRSGSGEHPRYALVGDPSCTYSRGPLPLWLKMSMGEAGFDHAKAADRLAFRTQNMVRVQP